jgi:hypothetical protein
MKKREAAMWLDPRAGFLALVLGGLAAACAQTTTGSGSGETHFLERCAETCAAGLQCLRGTCTRPCAAHVDCSDLSLAATCQTSSDGASDLCEQGCEDDRDCGTVSGRHTCIAGVCRAEPRPPTNGSGSDTEGSGGEPVALACAGGCGDGACAFDGTDCELTVACGAVACGGVNVDANACFRPACASDDDCLPEERCTPMAISAGVCGPGADPCTCPATPQGLATCSPIELAGPRGAWRSVTLTHRSELGESWLVYYPDGSARAHNFGEIRRAPVLSGNDAAPLRLNVLIDGRLRAVLSDPEGCPSPDREVELSLQLETITLTRIVTACNGEPELAELLELLTPD